MTGRVSRGGWSYWRKLVGAPDPIGAPQQPVPLAGAAHAQPPSTRVMRHAVAIILGWHPWTYRALLRRIREPWDVVRPTWPPAMRGPGIYGVLWSGMRGRRVHARRGRVVR